MARLKLTESKQLNVEDGSHLARLVRILDLGLQPNHFQPGTFVPQLDFVFEVLDTDEPKNPLMSRTVTAKISTHPKNSLSALIRVLAPKATLSTEEFFDFTTLLDIPVILNVVSQPGKTDPTKTSKKINTISPVLKGQSVPKATTDEFFFDMDNVNVEDFKKLPEFVRKKILAAQDVPEELLKVRVDVV